MNTFSKIGAWVEKHFPEKISIEEITVRFKTYESTTKSISLQLSSCETEIKSLLNRIHTLELMAEDMKKVKEELNSIRTNLSIKTKLTGSSPAMNPFAQRLPNIQPNGGNRSPQ